MLNLTQMLEDLRKAYEKIYKVRDWAAAQRFWSGLGEPGSLLLPLLPFQVFLDGDSDQDGVTWMATSRLVHAFNETELQGNFLEEHAEPGASGGIRDIGRLMAQ